MKKYINISTISLALTIIGIIFGYFWYKNPPQRYDLLYYTKNNIMLVDAVNISSNLEVRHNDKIVDNVRNIELFFYNNSKIFFGNNNIVNNKEITITPENEVEILQVNITNVSRQDLFKITNNKNSITVNVIGDEVVEHRDGFLISILYTGESTDFEMTGRIKGNLKGINKINVENEIEGMFDPVIYIVLSIILIPVGIYQELTSPTKSKYSLILFSGMAVFYIFGLIYFFDEIMTYIKGFYFKGVSI